MSESGIKIVRTESFLSLSAQINDLSLSLASPFIYEVPPMSELAIKCAGNISLTSYDAQIIILFSYSNIFEFSNCGYALNLFKLVLYFV